MDHPMVLVLLSTSVKRFSVYCMGDWRKWCFGRNSTLQVVQRMIYIVWQQGLFLLCFIKILQVHKFPPLQSTSVWTFIFTPLSDKELKGKCPPVASCQNLNIWQLAFALIVLGIVFQKSHNFRITAFLETILL